MTCLPTPLSCSVGQTCHSDREGWNTCQWGMGQVCPAKRTTWQRPGGDRRQCLAHGVVTGCDGAGAAGTVSQSWKGRPGPAKVPSPWSSGRGAVERSKALCPPHRPPVFTCLWGRRVSGLHPTRYDPVSGRKPGNFLFFDTLPGHHPTGSEPFLRRAGQARHRGLTCFPALLNSGCVVLGLDFTFLSHIALICKMGAEAVPLGLL